MKATDKQVGGSHYKNFAIEPIEFIVKNKLAYCEANVIKYVCRHKEKNGVQDIDKAIHYLELLKHLEYPAVEMPKRLVYRIDQRGNIYDVRKVSELQSVLVRKFDLSLIYEREALLNVLNDASGDELVSLPTGQTNTLHDIVMLARGAAILMGSGTDKGIL